MTQSSLTEIPLSELLLKDPLEHTSNDMTKICDWLRGQRAKFAVEDAKGKKAKPAAANISLEQLDIEF